MSDEVNEPGDESPASEASSPPQSSSSSTRVKLETLLGAGGALAKALPGFSPRPHQLALAKGVEAALKEARPCLAEAGTGTGKTVGYLVPLMRYLARRGERAILSTHTLALQAQLVERDIPALLAALPDLDIRPIVLKGRYNYLCLQDLEAAASDLTNAGDIQFRQIQRWSSETDSGDVAELDFTYPGWSEIAANVDTCRQRECRFYDRCFYYNARKGAEEANLLVVNHSLFFANLRLRKIAPGIPHLLPDYDAVVFDEAHHVEDMATRAFGLEWGSRRVPQLIHRLRRTPGIDQDRLRVLDRLHDDLLVPFLNAPRPEAFLDEAFASDLERAAFDERRSELSLHLNAFARDLTKIAETAESPADRDRANGLARTASRISTELFQVTKPDPDSEDEKGLRHFRWFHTRRLRNGQAFSTLVKTPLAIDTLMRENLFAETPRAIFVSATLATGSSGFDYIRKRIGLATEPPTPPISTPDDSTPAPAAAAVPPVPVEILEGSPFDYEANCLLYVPRGLGSPVGGYRQAAAGPQEDHTGRLTDEILALIQAARGRTFVLFTSTRMLQAVRERLWGRCDFPIFVQGEMPNGRLVEAFAASGDGVLLGTNSFWEGVDVPGEALSCVIIDKLPFATPDAPTERAREAFIREQGGDAFRELSLPMTQMRLKQGFGRLLRTETDRGVVAILDGRLWTKSYGRELLRSLPPCPKTDRIADVQAFFDAAANSMLSFE